MAERFVRAYLQAHRRARAFIPQRYDVAATRASVVARASKRGVAPAVQDALRRQNAQFAASPQREAHLQALAAPGTTCVVTGQQVGLFLGPLYTLYKAASAVICAQALQQETGQTVVPVFWLQSEDHDFEELATAWLPEGGAGLKALTAEGDSAGRASIAHRPLGPDLPDLLQQMEQGLAGLPHGQATLSRIRAHYRSGLTWVQAFAGLLAELFADEGLLLLDPRDPSLAAAARGVHQRALEQAPEIAEALSRRSRALQEAGFSVPVHIRTDAPLSFFHPDGAEGPRYRLSPAAEGWSLVGTERQISNHDLQGRLQAHPEQFSSSALLRPILQDSWLPTAAYVAGPGEIDYFAQMQPLYDAFDLPMPLLVPRARFAVTHAKQHKALLALGLSPEDLDVDREDLILKTSPQRSFDPSDMEQRMLLSLEQEFRRMQDNLPGISKSIERTRDTVQRACNKLLTKYELGLAQADTQRVAMIDRLQQALYPQRAPQERLLGLPYFAALYGDRDFVEAVLQACTPYEGALKELQL